MFAEMKAFREVELYLLRAELLRQPQPSAARIAEVVSKIWRRNEESRIIIAIRRPAGARRPALNRPS